MQQDKELKELLQQFAVEKTSVDFTQNVMHQIEAKMAIKPSAKPLVSIRLFWVLTGAFVLVAAILLALSFSSQFAALPLSVTLRMPENSISQLTWFIVVFWVVMLTNIAFQQKNRHAM